MTGVPMVRRLALVLGLLACAAIRAHAQDAIVAGTTLGFDHPADDAADTAKYQLCVDAVSDTACRDVAVLRVTTTDEYRFTLPDWVPRGNRSLTVRAVGVLGLGASGPSNAVARRVSKVPSNPGNLREVTP